MAKKNKKRHKQHDAIFWYKLNWDLATKMWEEQLGEEAHDQLDLSDFSSVLWSEIYSQLEIVIIEEIES